MKHITAIRTSVCTIANNLHRTGLTLSDAFRKAWEQVKETTFRVKGVMAAGRQKRLEYLDTFRKDDLQVGFIREKDNCFDKNAVAVLVMVKSIRKYTKVGYLPRVLAERLAPVMDKGIKIRAELGGILGGYGEKENYGMLVRATV